MCGRFTQQRPTSELAEIFEAEDLALDAGGHFNVAPTDQAAVVVMKRAEDPDAPSRPTADRAPLRRAIVRYRWGLLPAWIHDPRQAARAINARAETIDRSPLFREAFARRRCLVPVDSFYEWRGAGASRQPLRIHALDGGPLVFAGLWTGRRDADTGARMRTFTIVTSAPNEFMAPIHHRMPVALPRSDWDRWLDPYVEDRAELLAMIGPRSDVALGAHPVSRLVNDVRNNGPELIAPVQPLEAAVAGTLFD